VNRVQIPVINQFFVVAFDFSGFLPFFYVHYAIAKLAAKFPQSKRENMENEGEKDRKHGKNNGITIEKTENLLRCVPCAREKHLSDVEINVIYS